MTAEQKTRIPLEHARLLADEVVALLEPYAQRIVVAGSIRRRRADVGDVEIVAIPRHGVVQADLFAPGEGLNRDLLGARCVELLAEGVLAHRPDVNGHNAFGAKFKRLLYRGVPLDLFSPDAATWGVVLAIRTGPAEFSHRLVTPRRQGGLLPDWLRVAEGRIWRATTPLETPEEENVFEAINLPFIPPEARTGTERAAVAS
jgi:DNA polymerase/3'-5' exonuclease PolX